MSSWGNNDNAANAPYWAVNSAVAPDNPNAAKPDAANVALLFGNTSPNVYTTNETIGLFGVDNNEVAVERRGTHTGWVLRKEGSGGRAGRVQEEVLVALATMNGDNEDGVYKDAIITFSAQPATLIGPVDQASAQTATFSVTAAVTTGNTAAPLTYQWQVNNNSGGSWVNINAGTGVTTGQPGAMTKSGATTATLLLDPTGTTANNYVFRCVVTATGTGATATSANGRILIV